MIKPIISGLGLGTNVGAEALPDNGTFYNPVLIEMIGQSNAAGNAQVADLPSELLPAMTGVKVYNNVTCRWETLEMGVNNRGTTGLSGTGANDTSPTQYGSELRLMYLIKNNYPLTRYIFKYCISNTDLAAGSNTDWSTSSTGELTDRSITVIQNARQGMGDGRPPRVVIWWQGENDANNTTKASAYETNLTNLINYKRTAYGYTVPFIIVRLSTGGQTMTFLSTVNTAIDNVAGALSSVTTINTNDLTTLDGTHFDATSIDTIANRLFDELELRDLLG